MPARLGDVTESMKNGLYKPSTEYSDDGVPCLRMYNIDAGKIVWRDIKRMRVTDKELKDYGLIEGDLLVNRVNSRELVGKTAYIPSGMEASVFESKNIRLRLKKDKVLPKFINYQLLTFGRSHFSNNAQQVVGMASVSQKQLADFPIVITDIDHQKRIVAEIEKQFSRLDEAVANLKRVKANLKRYKAAVLKAAVEGRLVETEAELARREGRSYETGEQLLQRILETRRSQWKGKGKYKEPAVPDTTDLPELPEGWVWATWNQISQWVTYGFTRPMPHVDQGIPIVTAKHIVDGKIELNETHKTPYENFAELSNKDKPEPGDILITKDGTIGRAAVVPEHNGFCINQSVAVIWLRSSPIRREYLLSVIESELVQQPVRQKARGVAIKHLSITDFARLPIPIPPLLEQDVIQKHVSARMSVIASVEHSVNVQERRANSLRQSILTLGFSGAFLMSGNSSQYDPTAEVLSGKR